MFKSKKILKKAMALCLTAAMAVSLAPVSTMAAPKAKKISLTKKAITLKIGDRMTIKSNGKADIKAKFVPTKAVKSIKVVSDDKTVVKAKRLNKNAYIITAVDEGEAVITVQSLRNKKLKARLNVTVIENTDDENVAVTKLTARQSAENKVSATLSTGFADTVKKDNFNLKDKTGNSVVALEKITLSEDKKTVELQALINLNSGSVYELQYTNPVDKKVYTAIINSSKGEVAAITVNTKTVPMNVSKKLAYSVLDENGVDITATAKNFVSISADIPSGKGFYDAAHNELKMFDPSATAKITVTYQNGAKKIEGTGIVSVTKESTENVSIVTWGFSQATGAFDYTKADKTASKQIAKDTTNMKFYVSLKTSDGKEIKSDSDATVKLTSTDNNVFTMLGNTIKPVGKGTASIIVEYTYEGKTTKFTPAQVTIGDNQVAASILLNENTAIVTSIGTVDNIKLLAIKDQYGNDLTVTPTYTVSCLDSHTPLPTGTVAGGKIVINGNGAAVATYNFRVEASVGSSVASMVFSVIVRP